MTNQYVCSECNTPVVKTGTGLGTWHCPKRHERNVKVVRFTGSGKENDRDHTTTVTVNRHVKVRVIAV
jgi:ribosomal protein L37AE/L43A